MVYLTLLPDIPKSGYPPDTVADKLEILQADAEMCMAELSVLKWKLAVKAHLGQRRSWLMVPRSE